MVGAKLERVIDLVVNNLNDGFIVVKSNFPYLRCSPLDDLLLSLVLLVKPLLGCTVYGPLAPK